MRGDLETKDLPYYRMWVKDFDTDEKVQLLTLSEAGLYLFALNHAWINDGLPELPADIAKTLHVSTKEFNRNWPKVSPLFVLSSDGRRRNPRQESERALTAEKSVKASESAKHRWESDANASETHSERNARAYGSDSVSGFDSNKTSLRIENFNLFLEVCDMAEMRGSGSDLKAARFEWGRLSLIDQLAACKGIKDRIAAGELADPGFRPLMQNYLKNHTWERTIRDKRSASAPTKADRAVDILRRNLALEGKL